LALETLLPEERVGEFYEEASRKEKTSLGKFGHAGKLYDTLPDCEA
jgi:hypothetical protein